MIYSVKAKFIEDKMGEFYQKLTNGTIQNQKPDGYEIVNSMITAKTIEDTTTHLALFKLDENNFLQ